MSTAVTIRDVAKRAGVGVGTVSRVLNDSESVSESTRIKVQAAIEDLNYSPSTVARRLSSGKSMAIGVIVPFFTNASVVRRLQGIVSVIAPSEYDLVLFDVENKENRDVLLTNIVQRRMVDGLIILSLRPIDNDLERFLLADVPAVIVDAQHPELSSIYVDNVQGGRQATQHLIDLGHVKIGYISDFPNNPFNFAPVQDRREGFLCAIKEAGIPYNKDYYREGGLDSEEARQRAHELLNLPEPPTAVFAYSDTQAIGVLEAARDLGLRVPEDLSVIGYDDIEAAKFLQLTTIRQCLFDSGVKGAQLLLEVMSNGDQKPHELILPTELVVRSSTAGPAN
ncbi:MAG: LacI family DNA-binding transcriptional regulator [Candidatus Promineifilaceae bacterium]|nr:LacI family DNA-binding transcriptional regulator [Candidatus Promineifilaceae bacterium]